MTKKKRMLLKRTVPDKLVAGKWTYKIEEFEVTVLAVADGYAMVRRAGCMPFVEAEKDLHENS